jgi:hypothetical protein
VGLIAWVGPGLFLLAVLAVVAFFALRREHRDVQEGPGPEMYDSAWARLRRQLPHRRSGTG